MFGKIKRYSITVHLQMGTDIKRAMVNGKSAKDALQYFISTNPELMNMKVKRFDTTKPFYAVVSEIEETNKYENEQIDAFTVVREEKFTIM